MFVKNFFIKDVIEDRRFKKYYYFKMWQVLKQQLFKTYLQSLKTSNIVVSRQ